MKFFFLKLFSPILRLFEKEENGEEYEYSPSYRTILIVMGIFFISIAAVGLYFSMQINEIAGALPVILFSSIGIICLVIAGLGSDKAVSKLWRNRK